MWRNATAAQSWLPVDGDQVLAHGYVGLYAERGTYQLYVNLIRPAGRGQLYAAFEAMKERLAQEGLFDASRKRPLPAWPRRIAIVTSAEAAALRDILHVLAARWPLLDVVVFHTLVQGSEAPAQICAAIADANRYSREVEELDLIVIARGGGSIEDLWSFNDERVARAVAASALPTVAGVGHETDFTIVDFVADLRAPTPSVAAAAVTPDGGEVRNWLSQHMRDLEQRMTVRLKRERAALQQGEFRLRRLHPGRVIDRDRQRLEDRLFRLDGAMRGRMDRQAERLRAAQYRLAALSPLGVLQRGYSIVQQSDGRVVTDPATVRSGEMLNVIAAAGRYEVTRVGGDGLVAPSLQE
jgi:exodeoxyribonuclease VII large subunit